CAELLRDTGALEAITAGARCHFDGDQIAVPCVGFGARGDHELLAHLLLVDGHQAAARGGFLENPEHALPGALDRLDPPASVLDRIVLLAGLLHAQQRAVTDADNFAALRAARDADTDLRRRAVLGLVPFGWKRDQLPVGVARGDVRHDDLRQRARTMKFSPPPFDTALVGKLAQHPLKRDAVDVFHAEGTRDLTRADLAGLPSDECENVVFGGEGGFAHWVWQSGLLRDPDSRAWFRRSPAPTAGFWPSAPVSFLLAPPAPALLRPCAWRMPDVASSTSRSLRHEPRAHPKVPRLAQA